jgi:cytochrome c-type biogenesis protein CcmH
MFPYIAASILATVLTILLYPLWRSSRRQLPTGEEAVQTESRISRSLEREGILTALSDLEIDYAQRKLSPDDYHRLKLEQEHRLLHLLDQAETDHEPAPLSAQTASPAPWGILLAIGIWIVAGTVAVSSLVHGKIKRDQIAAPESAGAPVGPMGNGPIDPVKMVARLEERLRGNPNDLNGQLMLGRSYMVLERWEDAERTWKKVLELDERNGTAHAALGEVLLRGHPRGDQGAAEQALAHLDKALILTPQDPSLLWARGIALVTLGRFAEADEAWTNAYRPLSPTSEEAAMIKTALEALRSGKIQSLK